MIDWAMWATWAGAACTGAAAFFTYKAAKVALTIASKADLKKAAEDLRKARIVANLLRSDLQDIKAQAKRMEESMLETGAQFEKDFPQMLPTRWLQLITQIDLEKILLLAPYDSSVSENVAGGIGALRAATREMEDFRQGNGGWPFMSENIRLGHLERLQQNLATTVPKLETAIQQIDAFLEKTP